MTQPTLQPMARAAAMPRDDPAAALQEAVSLLRAEQLDDADRSLAAILQRRPDDADALHFQGILRHAQGRSDEGVALIRRAIASMPGQAGPWNNLGNVLMECQRFDEALQAYEASVMVALDQPESADALNNIGTLHRKRLDWPAAEQACRQAVALRPDFGDAWYNLSLALMGQQRITEGLLANSKAIMLWPRQLQARDQVIRALLLLGERDQAALLYREWLAEDPDNPVVQHQLAACLGEEPPARASDAYVETVFDSFSRSFDAKLESLHYQAPQLVAQALKDVLPDPSRQFDIADLGCGTGLVGPLVRPWARRLAGCDLSTGMLRKAKQRGVYDVLHKAELVHYLETQPEAFDVVVSADTLCYVGDLRASMAAAASALRPGGWLIFTVEAIELPSSAAFTLNPTGRYAHARRHLIDAAVAARLAGCERAVTLRTEAGRDVEGWLIVAQDTWSTHKMAWRVLGPVCQASMPQSIDEGTMCLAPTPVPDAMCHSTLADDTFALKEALAALQSEAETFAWRFINDAHARQAYVARIRAAAQELMRDVQASKLSAAEAARIANAARNTILEEVRNITSAIGRAGAEAAKATGLTFDQALDKAVKKLFPGKTLAELAAGQKRQVFLEIVEASGRSSTKVTSQIPKWTRFGKGLAVVTVAISAYNIWQAQNKLRQGVKEGATLAGGALGGAAANASAGFLCGPGAPVCVTALFIIGGIAGALIASSSADYVLDQKEVVAWLGE